MNTFKPIPFVFYDTFAFLSPLIEDISKHLYPSPGFIFIWLRLSPQVSYGCGVEWEWQEWHMSLSVFQWKIGFFFCCSSRIACFGVFFRILIPRLEFFFDKETFLHDYENWSGLKKNIERCVFNYYHINKEKSKKYPLIQYFAAPETQS